MSNRCWTCGEHVASSIRLAEHHCESDIYERARVIAYEAGPDEALAVLLLCCGPQSVGTAWCGQDALRWLERRGAAEHDTQGPAQYIYRATPLTEAIATVIKAGTR